MSYHDPRYQEKLKSESNWLNPVLGLFLAKRIFSENGKKGPEQPHRTPWFRYLIWMGLGALVYHYWEYVSEVFRATEYFGCRMFTTHENCWDDGGG